MLEISDSFIFIGILMKLTILLVLFLSFNELFSNYIIENKGQLTYDNGEPANDVLYYTILGGQSKLYFTKNSIKLLQYNQINNDIKIDISEINFESKEIIVKKDFDKNLPYFNFYLENNPEGLEDISILKSIEYKSINNKIDLLILSNQSELQIKFSNNGEANLENNFVKKINRLFNQHNKPKKSESTYFSSSEDDIEISSILAGDEFTSIMSVDSDGDDIFVSGISKANNLPMTNGSYQEVNAGNLDMFVFKLNLEGKIQWGTFVGSSNLEGGGYIAAQHNSVWVVGESRGPGFPIKGDFIHDSYQGGTADCALFNLNFNGKLQYSSYIGGGSYESILDVKFDKDDNAYFTGRVDGTNLYTTSDAEQKFNGGNYDAFLLIINSQLEVEYMSLFGNNGDEMGESIAVNDEYVYIGGYSKSSYLGKTEDSYQKNNNGNYDAFISCFDLTGKLQWSTFLGGGGIEYGTNIACDNEGNVVFSGSTSSDDFPTNTNAIQKYKNGNFDNFIAKFDKYGNYLWSSFLGGHFAEAYESLTFQAGGISTNHDNDIAFSFSTYSPDILNDKGKIFKYRQNKDSFLAVLNENGEYLWSSYFGGAGDDEARDVHFDKDGSLWFVGNTNSPDFYVKNDIFGNTTRNTTIDGFLLKFSQKKDLGNCPGGSFDFPSFNVSNEIVFSGDATLNDAVVRLTTKEMFRMGGVWYEDGVFTHAGFETSFSFKFSEGNNYGIIDGSLPGADGIAFVIQANEGIESGGFGGDIGFAGIKNSLAIEIDTYKNFAKAYEDPNGNHIAFFCNGEEPNNANHSGSALIAETSDIPTIMQDTVYTCTIEYGNDMFLIYLNKQGDDKNLVLQIPDFSIKDRLNLAVNGLPYVGIVSSTGNSVERHDILSWDFCSNIGFDFTSVDNDNNKDMFFDVYPTPSNDYIYINSEFIPNSVKITNSLGQIVYESEYKTTDKLIKIDTRNFSRGVYYIRANIKINNKVETKFSEFIKK